MEKKMVVCQRCGSLALPEFMVSLIDNEDKSCWLCDDCIEDLRAAARVNWMSENKECVQ